ncbi:MAG: NAD(P)H-dependent oxidoreductase [Candidatus Marinimicrobia bacterium]|nr:NAD(P)H-dependent oxidoreductase [Candidatus Neomarinimicrobiota bacterium]
MHLIISTSLNPNSRTRVLAEHALTQFQNKNIEAELIDLIEIELPFCDGNQCYENPTVQELTQTIANAESLIIASPIYNYDLNAVAKNLLELTGISWTEKVVGFICHAGGMGGYMSVMPFVNSLMLDFRCRIIPRFVYTTGDAFDGRELKDEKIKSRIEELVNSIIDWSSSMDDV